MKQFYPSDIMDTESGEKYWIESETLDNGGKIKLTLYCFSKEEWQKAKKIDKKNPEKHLPRDQNHIIGNFKIDR
jgi:hypothetical protein